MTNKLRQIWSEGKTAINGWLAIPNGFSAELMARSGYDTLTVDLQHGVQDYLSMVACFQAMKGEPVMPMVRVPWNEPGIIGKVLDGGAQGVICPMINTAEEAQALVAACKYPPHGTRSNGPIRWAMYGEPGAYQVTANEETLVLPMIETREAVANMDAILDVEGIAGAYIGPSDLGYSHGLIPKLDREEPEMLAILERVVEATTRRGLHPCLHCGTAAYAVRGFGMGFHMITVGSDAVFMSAASKAAVAHIRKESRGVF